MHDPLPLAASTLFPGPARDALTAAIAALELAEQRRQPAELCQALAQVSRCYRDVGLQEMAEGYLQQALRWASALDATDQSVDLLCEAAELSLLRGSPERAREQADEAARLARRTADPAWELAVLMRASDVLDRLGEHGQAIALHCRALSLITQDHLHEPQTQPAPLAQPAFSTTLM
jgi:tetratricopeptide (TPR) repeat protein